MNKKGIILIALIFGWGCQSKKNNKENDAKFWFESIKSHYESQDYTDANRYYWNDLNKYKNSTYADSAKEIHKLIANKLEEQAELNLKKKEKQAEFALKERKKANRKIKKNIKHLESYFHKNEDKFAGITWYEYNYPEGSPQEQATQHLLAKDIDHIEPVAILWVDVNNSGFYYLNSYYSASDWLFHDKVAVLINGSPIWSNQISVNSKNNIEQVVDGITEHIQFVKGGGNDIIERISKMASFKPILVRFYGLHHYIEYHMQKSEWLEIKRSYELARSIQKLQ